MTDTGNNDTGSNTGSNSTAGDGTAGGQEPAPPGPGWRPRANPRDRARDEIVAALDARVRRLNETATESADLLAQALPRIDTLAERVGELTGRVDELAGQVVGAEPAAPPPNPPVHWPELSAEQARAEWDRLASWVAYVLGPWYQVTRGQLPDCWALHPRAVITLSWLRTAYVAAYTPNGRPDAAAEWHTRWLPAALAQLEAAVPQQWCRPDTHLVFDAHGRRNRATRPAEPHEAENLGPGRPAASVPLSDDVTGPRYWGRYTDQAITEDVERRRRAEQATGDTGDAGDIPPT